MKYIVVIFSYFLFVCLAFGNIQAQTIKFQLTDGTYKEYQLSDIDKLTFENASTYTYVSIFRKNDNITRFYTAYISYMQIEKINSDTSNLLIAPLGYSVGNPITVIPISDIDSVIIMQNENKKFPYNSALINITDVNFVYEHKIETYSYYRGEIDSTYRDTTSGSTVEIYDSRCLDAQKLFYTYQSCPSCLQNGINLDSNSLKICYDEGRYYYTSGTNNIEEDCDIKELVIKFSKNKNIIDTLIYSYKKNNSSMDMSTIDQSSVDSNIILTNIPYIQDADSLVAEITMSALENIFQYSSSDSSGSGNSGYGSGSSITLVGFYPESQKQPKIKIVLRK